MTKLKKEFEEDRSERIKENKRMIDDLMKTTTKEVTNFREKTDN